jgi:hypothetical protein
MYHDALELLVEVTSNNSLPADVVPQVNLWHGNIIAPVDPSRTRVKTDDLLKWLQSLTKSDAPEDLPVTDEQSKVSLPKSQQADIEEGMPGELPRIAVGKLAVKAAWEIEREMKRRATDKEVMSLLQKWADDGSEPGVLRESDRENRCVVWLTTKCEPKDYTLEACQKTLDKWNKSRQ